jgi:hypothetical protein
VVVNTDLIREAPDATMTILSESNTLGLDVNKLLKATRINTKRPNVDGDGIGVAEKLVLIREEQAMGQGTLLGHIHTYRPLWYWLGDTGIGVPFRGASNDPSGSDNYYLNPFNKRSTAAEVVSSGDYYVGTDKIVVYWGLDLGLTVAQLGYDTWIPYGTPQDRITTSELIADSSTLGLQSMTVQSNSGGISFPRTSERVGEYYDNERNFLGISTMSHVPIDGINRYLAWDGGQKVFTFTLNHLMSGESSDDTIRVIAIEPTDHVHTDDGQQNVVSARGNFAINWFRTEKISGTWKCYMCVSPTTGADVLFQGFDGPVGSAPPTPSDPLTFMLTYIQGTA